MRPGNDWILNIPVMAHSIFMPLGGKHHVSVRGIEQRQTGQRGDKISCGCHVSGKLKIILVMDKSIHKPASLYKKYPAVEARRIIKRLDSLYAQAKLADIAEESRQSLSHRIGDIPIRPAMSYQHGRQNAQSRCKGKLAVQNH